MALLVGVVLHALKNHLGLNKRGPLLPHVLNYVIDIEIWSNHLEESARISAVQ